MPRGNVIEVAHREESNESLELALAPDVSGALGQTGSELGRHDGRQATIAWRRQIGGGQLIAEDVHAHAGVEQKERHRRYQSRSRRCCARGLLTTGKSEASG